MKQSYYGISNEHYDELKEKAKTYTAMTKKIFDKSLTVDEKALILRNKECLNKEIVEFLTNKGQLLGYFYENEFDLLSETEKLFNQKTREVLGSNCIAYEKLHSILVNLSQVLGNKCVSKLSNFIEKAEKQKLSVFIWIMAGDGDGF